MGLISVPADFQALAFRLALATLLGATIGLNREVSSKPAGLRTHALVGLGAALVTTIGLLLALSPGGDINAPSRIIQGLLAGIGFLGAGAIMRAADGHEVHGLTTAATIWIVAAVGVAMGAGLWRPAVLAVGLALLVLIIGGPIDRRVHKMFQGSEKEN